MDIVLFVLLGLSIGTNYLFITVLKAMKQAMFERGISLDNGTGSNID